MFSSRAKGVKGKLRNYSCRFMRSENASALLYIYFFGEILSSVMRALRERAHLSQFDRTALSLRWATVHICCRSRFV